ncbi:MAG: hypothetical protein WD200_01080 [Candidatus Andersenbacteria bacterium]
MTLEVLSTIFSDKKSLTWQDEDIRFFVERHIAEHMKQIGAYCQVVNESTITVRVPTPVAYQEVSLGIYDIQEAIKHACGRSFHTIRVTL